MAGYTPGTLRTRHGESEAIFFDPVKSGVVTDGDGVAVDPHVKILDEHVVARAKARGLDVLVYAPHFTRLPTIQRRAAEFSDEDLLVVPAREIFTGSWRDRRHVLALGLESPVPDFCTLEGTMAELRRQDATVLAPHPEFLNVSLGESHLQAYRDTVDGIEVYNPKHLARDNRRAQALAREFDLPTFASSYAHLSKTVGEVWTRFGRDIDSEADLLDALQSGAPRRIFHREGRRHRLRCRLEFGHLGYENTVTKFDRIALSGLEPTHPAHVAYGGTFDDIRVY